MTKATLASEQALAIMEHNPRRLAVAIAGADLDQLRVAPAEDEWAISEVLAHLRSCADVWGNCIRRILTEDHPTIKAVNPKSWLSETNYCDIDVPDSLAAFADQRIGLLALLASLTPGDWERSATVTRAGSPLERTLFDYVQRLARHEQTHVRQIERDIASMDRVSADKEDQIERRT